MWVFFAIKQREEDTCHVIPSMDFYEWLEYCRIPFFVTRKTSHRGYYRYFTTPIAWWRQYTRTLQWLRLEACNIKNKTLQEFIIKEFVATPALEDEEGGEATLPAPQTPAVETPGGGAVVPSAELLPPVEVPGSSSLILIRRQTLIGFAMDSRRYKYSVRVFKDQRRKLKRKKIHLYLRKQKCKLATPQKPAKKKIHWLLFTRKKKIKLQRNKPTFAFVGGLARTGLGLVKTKTNRGTVQNALCAVVRSPGKRVC